jgi:HEAT repeat protein
VQPSLPAFFAVSTVATAALAVMVTVRKLRRDRREARNADHRSSLRAALRDGGRALDDLLLQAVKRTSAQVDLAAVLPAAIRADGEAVRVRARDAAERAGLAAALEQRLHARRATARGSAAMLAGQLGLSSTTATLGHMLADPDDDVRLVAAGALGQLATGAAADALVAGLAHRMLAPERLIERLGGVWATPTILARLRDEVAPLDAVARSWLARALGLAADTRAESTLVDLLESPELEIRVSAVRALATCGTDACRTAVIRALEDDAWEVRAQAALTLGELGVIEAVPVLAVNLCHRAWWVRANAATALGRLGAPGIHALRRAADGDDAYAAERAAEVLAFLGEAA